MGVFRDALPAELIARDQWLCWKAATRDGKQTKLPVDPRTGEVASATDCETWTSFETAHDAVETDVGTGLGFAFDAEGPYVGVDLDDCRDPETGELTEWARDIVTTLDSYTEVSPSGEGVHVLVTGSLPPGRNRRGNVECYEENRFFTVTGDHVADAPDTVEGQTQALATVYDSHLATEEDSRSGAFRQHISRDAAEGASTDGSDGSRGAYASDESPAAAALSDAELLRRARNAANGAKFDRLWRGDASGYASQSEADMALCALLAFWTGGDHARVDSLFRQSGLLRQKWDDVHYADGRTYGEVTVRRAVDGTDEFYEPQDTSEKAIVRDGPVDGIRVDAGSSVRQGGERSKPLEKDLAHAATSQTERDDRQRSQHSPRDVDAAAGDGSRSTDESWSACREAANSHDLRIEPGEDGDVDAEVRRLRSELARVSSDLSTRETELARLKQTLSEYESELDSKRGGQAPTDRNLLSDVFESLRRRFSH